MDDTAKVLFVGLILGGGFYAYSRYQKKNRLINKVYNLPNNDVSLDVLRNMSLTQLENIYAQAISKR